jgi:hypothetical protein
MDRLKRAASAVTMGIAPAGSRSSRSSKFIELPHSSVCVIGR